MSLGRPISGLEQPTCPKCGAPQESPGSTVCEQCGADLAGATVTVTRPPSPHPISRLRSRFRAPARLLRWGITVLDAGFTALTRGVSALIGVIAALIRVVTVLVLLGSLIIGLSFVPEVSARIPGLKTVSETALKAVSTTGKKVLQRAQELGSGLLSGSKTEAPSRNRTSPPAATSQKPAQKVAQKAAPGRPVAAQPLTIKSTPTGATVQLNARRVGKTPLTLKVAPGTYKVRISRPGYVSVTRTITVKRGKAASLSVTLAAPGPAGDER